MMVLTGSTVQNVFGNPGSVGSQSSNALGLAALAIMERRISADQNAAPTGYDNATPPDRQNPNLADLHY